MQVRLANKLAQSLKVSVRGADGKLADVTLAPFAQSELLNEDALSVHAQQLIAAGYIKVRRA